MQGTPSDYCCTSRLRKSNFLLFLKYAWVFVLIVAGSLAAKPQLIYGIYPKLFGIRNGGCTVYDYTTLSDDFRSRDASASETDTNVQSR